MFTVMKAEGKGLDNSVYLGREHLTSKYVLIKHREKSLICKVMHSDFFRLSEVGIPDVFRTYLETVINSHVELVFESVLHHSLLESVSFNVQFLLECLTQL